MQTGESVPHFDLNTLSGQRFSYASIWQYRSLVLVTLPADESEATRRYSSRLLARTAEFLAKNAECVVTRDHVSGLPSPGAVVADRWGEIIHVATAPDVDSLPSPDELLEWIDYLEKRCPECEGEAR